MPTLTEFSDAIEGWSNCVEAAELANANRDFTAYQRAFHEAERHFAVIRRGIGENLHEAEGHDLRAPLARVAGKWEELAQTMQTWKGEIKDQLEQTKRRRSRGKKIRNGYGPKQNVAGRNLRLRAK